LIDMRGTVVGINTMIHQEQRVSRIGFAIPSGLIKVILPQLLRSGSVVRSWLGVDPSSDPEEVQATGIPSGRGVIVKEVRAHSPAEAAGLHPGDVIAEFDARPIESDAELRWLAAMAGPGHQAKLRVWRGGKFSEMAVTLVRKPNELPPVGERAAP